MDFKQPKRGSVHSRCQIQPEYYISVDFMVNDSHTKRCQFFNVDALGRGGYGKLNPCVDFVPEHDGPQIKVAMNGVKNRQFNFPNCELDQWYNLTITQEEINENKYKFTATVTELADEGDTDSVGNSQSVSCFNMKPVRSGHGWVRMCGPHNPAANVSYANFTIKFGNEMPPIQNGVLSRRKMKAAPTTAAVEDIEDLLTHMEIDPELELEEEVPVEEEVASANIPQLPITMDQSAGMMDLNKLLEDNQKCMVLLGTGCWNCKKVASFMDEVYDQHPDVQMIKYQGRGLCNFLRGPINEGLAPYKNSRGMFSVPIVCFFEQKNLVKTFAGLKMPAIEDALDALSAMPLSEPVSEEDLMEAAYDAGLVEHNRLRALHKNTPPMVQGLKVTIAAQAWADKLVNDWKGPGYSILHHAPNSARPGQGENIAYNFEVDAAKACVAATKAWYDEIKDYNYASPGFGYNTGHFTQVVWKDATKLGMGVSQLSNGAWVVVGRYSGEPGSVQGNMSGRFPENVLPLSPSIDE